MARGYMKHLRMGRRKQIPGYGQVLVRPFPIIRPDYGNQHLALDEGEPLLVPAMAHPAPCDICSTCLYPVETIHALEIEAIDKGYRTTLVGMLSARDQTELRVEG